MKNREALKLVEETSRALNDIIENGYKRRGKYEDYHVHPEVFERGKKVIEKIKLSSGITHESN